MFMRRECACVSDVEIETVTGCIEIKYIYFTTNCGLLSFKESTLHCTFKLGVPYFILFIYFIYIKLSIIQIEYFNHCV